MEIEESKLPPELREEITNLVSNGVFVLATAIHLGINDGPKSDATLMVLRSRIDNIITSVEKLTKLLP